MSKNNPIWSRIREGIGKVIVTLPLIIWFPYAGYTFAFGGLLNQTPSLYGLLIVLTGGIFNVAIILFCGFYFINNIIPFIWNGFRIRYLKL